MRVLLTNAWLVGYSGTEVVLGDTAAGLRRRGHAVMLFALKSNDAIRQAYAGRGLTVSSGLAEIEPAPDIIHGQHGLALSAALSRFPGAPAIQLIHDPGHWADEPLIHPAIGGYVAVDEERRARAIKAGIAPDKVAVLHNAVDLERFRHVDRTGHAPERAIAILKGPEAGPAIASACRTSGLKLEVIGRGVGREIADFHTLLPAYQIVFASGRCAMEAIAAGLATIVCDSRDYGRSSATPQAQSRGPGLAGLATAGNWPRLRAGNFGISTLTEALTPHGLREAIERVDLAAAAALSRQVRAELSLETYLDRLEAIYRAVIDAHRSPIARDAIEPAEDGRFARRLVDEIGALELMVQSQRYDANSLGRLLRQVARTARRTMRRAP